jgi:hypothetical protein
MLRFTITVLSISLLFPGMVSGESSADQKPKPETGTKQASSVGQLVATQKIGVASEVAGTVDEPLTCDSDGNIYLQSEQHGVSGVRKINPKGQRVALFQPNANPDLKIDLVGYFALKEGGELYQLVFAREITRYVFVYKSDGTYKSAIKLQPGFAWQPSTMAVFPSGNLLVSGLEYDHDRKNPVTWPFAGIFGSDGVLLKEVKLEDDDAIHNMALSGDQRVSSFTNPSANHAVEFSKMEAGADGNIYLMRWLTPAIFYAISPGGEVVRRFTVDPGDQSYQPTDMHISGNRIAVVFFQPQSRETRMKVVDLEGHEIATYDAVRVEGKPKPEPIGEAFACYTADPGRFVFLSAGDDNNLQFLVAEPR